MCLLFEFALSSTKFIQVIDTLCRYVLLGNVMYGVNAYMLFMVVVLEVQ
jgi:hypothetical protein